MAHIFMAVSTIVCLIMASFTDIKEKQIYTFPCTILTVLWGSFLMCNSTECTVIYVMWLINIGLYIVFNVFGIWGAGDSDLLLMCVDVMLYALQPQSVIAGVFAECLFFVVSLAIATLVGAIELKIRGKKFSLKEKVAVAPGMSVCTMALLIIGVIGRMM